jgi:hypothetical protein
MLKINLAGAGKYFSAAALVLVAAPTPAQTPAASAQVLAPTVADAAGAADVKDAAGAADVKDAAGAADVKEAEPERIVVAKSDGELRAAVRAATPGTRIEIAPGTYTGSFFLEGMRGQPKRRITFAGADPKNPPLFKGSIQFSDPAFLSVQDIAIEESPGNGLNIDDGTGFDNSARGVVVRRVRVSKGLATGNSDGIKLSGLQDFRIEDCTLEFWGLGGAGIDMVGCHQGVIQNNLLRHDADPEKTGSTGIQAKGGCRDIAIRSNRFENAGARGINVGGSTGMAFFRPPIDNWFPNTPFFEAKDLTIEGNTFIGSVAPVSFVGVDGALVRFNLFYKPRKWAMRILQETMAPGFVPSRNGVFTDNIVVWNSQNWTEGGVNIGPGTEAKSFRFARNWWWCEDRPERSRPNLPSPEEDGVYSRDPLFEDAAAGKLELKPESPARAVGAEAWVEEK